MFIKIRNASILIFLTALIFAAGSVKALSAAQEDETTSTPSEPISLATIETFAPVYDLISTETTTPEITSTSTIESVLIETLPLQPTSIDLPTNTVPTINLFPISYTTQSGDTGGQLVNFMATQDQTGAEDNPNAYVLFTPLLREYKGIHVFQFPNTVSLSSLQTLSLKVNYKGSAFTSQEWSWSLFNWTNQEWISIGTNDSAVSDTWTSLNFQTTQPSQFISSTSEIQVQLQSNNSNGDAKIDFETIELTYEATNLLDTPTEVAVNTPTSTPGELIPSESTQIYTPSIDLLPSQTPSPDITSTSAIEPKQTATSTTTKTTKILGLTAAVNSPSVPILVLPEDNVSTTNYAPRLDWTTSKLPAGTTFQKYELQLAVNNSFPAPTIINVGGLATNSKFTLNWKLDSNKKYYWRVRAFNTLGKSSAWSQVGSFRTAPLPPTLLTPSDKVVLLNKRPVFDWQNVSGATSYRIQLSQNKTFTTLITNSTTVPSTFTQNTDLPGNTTFYWRVQSISKNGKSAWSKIRTIYIKNQSQKVYYVAVNGNNANPGTQAQPWQTIQKAVTTTVAGDTIVVRGGKYVTIHGGWNFQKSGTQTKPITLTNFPGEQVVIKINQAAGDNYPPFRCLSSSTDPISWQTTKADFIHVIGADVTPRVLSNGVVSQKGIVIQGVEGEQINGFDVTGCDHWEVAGIDFIETATGIRTWKHNYQTMDDNSADYWYVHHNRVYNYYRESGMQFNGNFNVIENNEIYKVSNRLDTPYNCQMLNLLGNNNIVRENILSRKGSTANCLGILFEWDLSDANIVEQNRITGVPIGIAFHGGDNNSIKNNYIVASPNTKGSGVEIASYDNRTTWPCDDYAGSGSSAEALLPPNNPSHPDYPYYFNPRNCHSMSNQIIGNTILGFKKPWIMYPISEKSNIFRDNITSQP